MPTLKYSLALDLAEARLDRKQLAQRLGVTVQAIAKWVAQDHVPAERLPALLEVLGPDARSVRRSLAEPPLAAPMLMAVPTWRDRPQDTKEDRLARLHPGQFDQAFVEALPEHLQAHTLPEQSTLLAGLARRRFDYVSDRLVLDIRHARAVMFNHDPSLVRLAVARAALGPTRLFLLALVAREPLPPLQVQRLTADAALLGVMVVQVGSPADLAATVEQLEKSDDLQDDGGGVNLNRQGEPA